MTTPQPPANDHEGVISAPTVAVCEQAQLNLSWSSSHAGAPRFHPPGPLKVSSGSDCGARIQVALLPCNPSPPNHFSFCASSLVSRAFASPSRSCFAAYSLPLPIRTLLPAWDLDLPLSSLELGFFSELCGTLFFLLQHSAAL